MVSTRSVSFKSYRQALSLGQNVELAGSPLEVTSPTVAWWPESGCPKYRELVNSKLKKTNQYKRRNLTNHRYPPFLLVFFLRFTKYESRIFYETGY